MKLLFENWRKVLKEAKFEGEATKMVRGIVNKIKDHLKANKGEPRVKPRFGSIKHPLESIVYDNKYFGGLSKSLEKEGIKKITFQLRVEPSTAFGEGKKFSVSGQTMTSDDDSGGEMVRDRIVAVKVSLSDEFRIGDMSELIEKMKDTTVHELTHGGQSIDVLKKAGKQQKKAFQSGLASIDALGLYYLDPSEIEAYARGTYKRAKMSKVAFSTKLDETIGEFINFYAHPQEIAKSEIQYTKDEVIDFFKNDYRQSIIDYAKKNLPAAVIKDGEQETF